MSVPPPPGSFAPQPDGPPNWLQPGPPPGANKSSRAKVIAGLVAVAVLSGGGVFIATRADDSSASTAQTDATDSTAGNDETGSTVDTTDVDTTDAPEVTGVVITAPDTPATAPIDTRVALPPITAPASTTTSQFVVPDGAVDLGYQVYLPLPTGWSVEDQGDGPTTVGDGTGQVTIQALARTPGEDPSVLTQEYIDTFDADFDIGYSRVRYYETGLGSQIHEYGLGYRTLDSSATDGIGLGGFVYILQRGDGLSVVYDVFTDETTMGISGEAFAELIASLAAAPLVGETVTLQQFPTFRIESATPSLVLENGVGMPIAPDFTEVVSGGARARARYDNNLDVTADLIPRQPSVEAALAAAQTLLSAEYTGISYEAPVVVDSRGYERVGVSFSATYISGGASTGGIDVLFDPVTGNAIAFTRAWYATDDGSEPQKAASNFMFIALASDVEFAGIP